MHSWHIAFQDLSQSFESYRSKNIVSNAFYPKFLETKRFQKESILKMNSIVMELFYFSSSKFLFANQIVGSY
jgi:hypothetical protein